MEGDLSESDGEPRQKTYSEIFNENFPYYLAMGMTYDQFWNESCDLVKCYRKAHKIQRDKKNEELWLQGLYFCKAINGSVVGKYFKLDQDYPETPLDLYDNKKESDADREKKQMLYIKERMKASMIAMNRKFEKVE